MTENESKKAKHESDLKLILKAINRGQVAIDTLAGQIQAEILSI
jgi:hypothetical protein